jgi:hypothetical protein
VHESSKGGARSNKGHTKQSARKLSATSVVFAPGSGCL